MNDCLVLLGKYGHATHACSFNIFGTEWMISLLQYRPGVTPGWVMKLPAYDWLADNTVSCKRWFITLYEAGKLWWNHLNSGHVNLPHRWRRFKRQNAQWLLSVGILHYICMKFAIERIFSVYRYTAPKRGGFRTKFGVRFPNNQPRNAMVFRAVICNLIAIELPLNVHNAKFDRNWLLQLVHSDTCKVMLHQDVCNQGFMLWFSSDVSPCLSLWRFPCLAVQRFAVPLNKPFGERHRIQSTQLKPILGGRPGASARLLIFLFAWLTVESLTFLHLSHFVYLHSYRNTPWRRRVTE